MKKTGKYGQHHFISVIVSVIFLMTIQSCSGIKNLGPDEISELLSSGNDNLVVIDLRSAADFSDGHIKGALNIPFSEETFAGRIASVENGNKAAIIYCGRGIRTQKARPLLEKSSFRKIYILEGGFEAWKNKGFGIAR